MAAFMAQVNGAPGALGGAEDDRLLLAAGGTGPIRRGGGGNRYGQRMGGPYDRPGNKDARNGGRAAWNNGGAMGRLSPPRGAGQNGRGGIGGGGGRFPDGGAMGPREAVQGRSLKSYEDLDAAGGGQGTEDLDY
jgi:serrate RNA effector molecule